MANGGNGFDLPPNLTLEWLAYRVLDLSKRTKGLEDENKKYDPAVQDILLKNLIAEVAGVKRAVYGLMFVIVSGSITFAFTVFALLGH